MLKDESRWESVDIDYHPPRVERVWTQHGDYRVYLHRIHPCKLTTALYHPHPWPSAVRLVKGTYAMGVGREVDEGIAPEFTASLILEERSQYEMTDINGWHYVQPLTICYTLMVTGPTWDRESPKSDKPLQPLTAEAKASILDFFRTHRWWK